MIKFENLRVFVTVAELGNIKDASQRLAKTTSAISMTLKQLEEAVGGALFETDRKNRLTALGSFVFDAGQIQIRAYDKAVGSIRAYAHNRIGSLALASVPSVAANLIPRLLPRFVGEYPSVEIELSDMDSDSVRRKIENGQADLGIAGRPQSEVLVTFEALFRDRFKVICSTSNDLAKLSKPIWWSDLERETLILNGASDTIQSTHYQALAEQAKLTVRNVTSLHALVKSGLGITLLPAFTTQNLPKGLLALDLADTSAERVVGLLERRNASRSPVAAAFREFVLDEMPGLIDSIGLERI